MKIRELIEKLQEFDGDADVDILLPPDSWSKMIKDVQRLVCVDSNLYTVSSDGSVKKESSPEKLGEISVVIIA